MLKKLARHFIGPRVPAGELPRRWWRYVIPMMLFIIAGTTLIVSYSQPYWRMTLVAPQYPRGLHVQAYLNRLEGDVREIDGLNHYIGMRPLNEAAQLERRTSHILIGTMAALMLAALFINTKWVVLFALPALLFPAGFLLDLYLWMDHFGQNLDPTAALSNAVKPFTPPIWGEGKVGNFRTVASVDIGWWMALGASLCVLTGLYFHRRAYKPLVDRAHRLINPDRDKASRGSGTTPIWLGMCTTITIATTSYAQIPDDFDLQKAITEAESGATIRVSAGTYAGPIEIERPLTLIADGGAVIDSGGTGTVVRITGADVTMRGFMVRGSGTNLDREDTGILVAAPRAVIENNIVEDCLFGISFKQAPDSIMRGNTIIGKDIYVARRGDGIKLWASPRSLIDNNRVRDVRDAVMWYSDDLHIVNNHISGSRYGLHFMYSHDNVMEENLLEENSVGVFLMYSRNLVLRRNIMARNRGPSGYGLGVKDMQGMIVENNLIVGNRVGAYIDNPPIYLPEHDRFTRNVFASNDIGIIFQPSVQRVAVYENSFIDNLQQVALAGGGELRRNEFMRDGKGNYWSDYRGFDLAGDGIGDMPYQAESLWDDLMNREPGLRLFMFSPAQQAVEMAAKAFPLVRPRPLFTDDAPLMKSVRADVPIRSTPSTWPLVATMLGLLSIAALGLLAARPITASREKGAAA